MSLHRFIPLVLVITACSSKDRRPPPPAPAAPPQLVHGTQADLATELDDAERRGTYAEVKKRWQGQRLHWTITRHKLLCSSEELCNVAAFPIQRPAARGWMPKLGFAPGQFAALEAACGDSEECEIAIEGTLAELDVSGERATKLRFSDVKLAGPKLAAR
jgi:hypothetical protein